MSTKSSQYKTAHHLPVSLIQPGGFTLNDAQQIAAVFAAGAQPVSPRRMTRATLPDIDFENVVIAPRRTFLTRMKAAYRAFFADAEPRFALRDPLRAGANIVPFRKLA